jgi:hypothetical protein
LEDVYRPYDELVAVATHVIASFARFGLDSEVIDTTPEAEPSAGTLIVWPVKVWLPHATVRPTDAASVPLLNTLIVAVVDDPLVRVVGLVLTDWMTGLATGTTIESVDTLVMSCTSG